MYCSIPGDSPPLGLISNPSTKCVVRQSKCGLIACDSSATMREESEYLKMTLYEHSQFEISIAIHKETTTHIINCGHATLYVGITQKGSTVYATRLEWMRNCSNVQRVLRGSSLVNSRVQDSEWTTQYFMPRCEYPTAPIVPYAVFLSGGARSIGVAARLARQHLEHESTPLVAYVAGYDDADFIPARIAAERLRLDLREVWMHPHIDIERAIEQTETFHEDTLLHRHLLHQLGLAAKRDGFDIVFTGDLVNPSTIFKGTLKGTLKGRRSVYGVSTLQIRCAGENIPTVTTVFGSSMLEEQRRRKTLRGETWLRDVFQNIFGEDIENCTELTQPTI